MAPPPDRAPRWAAILLAGYLALMLVVAAVPRPIDHGVTPWLRGVLASLHGSGLRGWIDYELIELTAHALLFVPFGILAVVALGRRLAWLAVLTGFGLGTFVEFAPSTWLPDHAPSLVDLLMNAAGTVAGAAIGCWALRAPRRYAAQS
ncbi:VanZ family protein [Agromyces bauzanensis]